ncbi:MAG: hypothetical protein IPG55_03375 [Saprospiraceae bacterium]|nr:hypothetical protein [Candidatus Defluviibacterium haderslevense]
MTNRISLIVLSLSILLSCKKDCRIIKDTHKNGNKKIVHIYKDCNDTNYYLRQFYFANGQLGNEGFFKDNKKIGRFKSWYDNGQIEADWDNLNGNENGFIQCWFKNGKIKKVGTLINGIENGIHKTWFENGQQESEGNFMEGKKEGLWKYWNETLEYKERNYHNDSLDGQTKEIYNDNSQVLGQYKNSKEFGKWIWKDSIGNITQIAFYNTGVYDGITVQSYPNGNKRKEINYKKGKIISEKNINCR